ncbi:MAG: tRNA (N(6)-L-threonylcarbamoyladenosine(37)-C(2))-methylthiotransferase MtaB [Anaerolineae bacterium]|nr:tRNA (N(6)-L-threonylcarbamoyladenosine(37)-C(2))-methylthiotransferase MtaB [Anaerolineae bacterium]
MTKKKITEPRRVHLAFIGCRLNQAEIDRMARQFMARGYTLADGEHNADLVVINTCAVTHEAERKSRQAIRRAGRENPGAEIIVTGCYAHLSPDEMARLPNVSHVFDNDEKARLVDELTGKALDDIAPLPPGTLGHTRAFVKVQDGCDNHCTYCVTRIARGSGQSRPASEITQEIRRLTDSGYNEVVLTGVNLGSYGRDWGQDRGLESLVQAILAETPIKRLRLSSLEPWEIDAAFFELWKNPRLCPHLHLPLQSGSDGTLQRMGRQYTVEAYKGLIEAARQSIPDVSITSDVIVGFPGETDETFEETARTVEAIGFSRLHVFPYSEREGTAAARLPGQVDHATKTARKARLLELSERQWRAYQEQHIGRTFDVLWESSKGETADGSIWSGLTGNMLRVIAVSAEELRNTIRAARLEGIGKRGIRAVVESSRLKSPG